MWSPVVGSSKIYKVFPVALLDNSVASFTLWASPPDKVVDGCPKFNITEVLHHKVSVFFVLF